ncbi:MAG TPA: rod shape-determining protein MreC [Candidatus Sulfopaludibacter sp.]|jgi:rod shape-determining protein MreC|nr:rod shape-determining protein MreC [Candidatus Sulfopaludibacter sp.]
MESFLNRFRHITVLLLVICAQLVLLAVQVKNDQDVRFIRIWTISAVTPVARFVEALRGGSAGFLHNYITLHDTNAENRRLKEEVGRLKLENVFLKNELNTADRAKALQIFQSVTPSQTLAANVIAVAPGSDSKVVTINRGSLSGVERGMAVVTPDGIVGKVTAAYPTAAMVQLVTDPEFAAGVVSQKSQVRGTLKGQGTPTCKVDYVAVEEKVEPGEEFFTSGDDRVFPRGFPVGVVRAVRTVPGSNFKEILVDPLGVQHGVEDVLIILHGVHQDIPDAPPANQPVYLTPPPPAPTQAPGAAAASAPPPVGTEADKVRAVYKNIGEVENHTFGEGAPGTKPPDFNIKLPNGATATPGAAGTGIGARAPAPAASPVKPPDVSRRANQAAGAPEGSPKK